MALSRTVKHLRLLVILVIALEAIGIFLHLMQIDLLGDIINGKFVSVAQVNKYALWGNGQFIFHLALYSFAGLFFLRWTYVSQSSKENLDSSNVKSLLEVFYIWLIPVLNLIKPLKHISGFSLSQYNKTDTDSLRSYQRLINLWWILWLSSGPVGRFFVFVFHLNISVVESYSYLLLYVVLELLSILTGILFVVILGRQLKFIRKNRDALETIN